MKLAQLQVYIVMACRKNFDSISLVFFQVGASEAALLQMLKIRPFHYGLILNQVYDNGSVFSLAVLDITDDDIVKVFCTVSISFLLFAWWYLKVLTKHQLRFIYLRDLSQKELQFINLEI